ncbi:MAG: ribonuclease H-like YkuK family protein [Patescibacteria group bacterium]
MDFFNDGKFYNPTKGNLFLEEVIEEIICYMGEKPTKSYEIVVGCDSSASEDPTFPTVIVVLRKGEGGRFFLKRIHYPAPRKFYNLHDRILEEVLLSCQLALWLRDNFATKLQERVLQVNYQFQYIHADIGENGATKDMIREVTGLIRGNGFEPKIKPESFAASTVADRFS